MAHTSITKARTLLTPSTPSPSAHAALGAAALAAMAAVLMAGVMVLGPGVRFDELSGYAVSCNERGRAADGVWAVGECTGIPFDPERIVAQAERVAADVEKALGG